MSDMILVTGALGNVGAEVVMSLQAGDMRCGRPI